jgi:hypothetical protein
MKKIILLMILIISMSGCDVSPRALYFQKYPRYKKHAKPGKIYKPYFRNGRY